tara:strand:- start:676 stop:1626 length:951 start_codon:yes stop_codon:yes gene_type:complete
VLGNLNVKPYSSVILDHDGSDDAAVVRLDNGTLIIQTVDFFTPVVDNPYQFGQIAAANALSDIYAMGGKPLFALNIVGFPINDLPKSILTDILQGGADKADEAGIPIVGGHSVDDKEPKYGLVVTGEIHQDRIWKNSGARPGDALVLTKKLGTGIIATGIKKGVATQDSIESAINSMSSLNKDSAQELREYHVNAVTDVTGFGLLGHLKEVCENSNVSSKINFQDLLFLDGAKELAMSGVMPGGTKRNLKSVEKVVSFSDHLSEIEQLLSADAQTSGGLLISMPMKDAKSYVKRVNNQTAIIGQITEKRPYLVRIH